MLLSKTNWHTDLITVYYDQAYIDAHKYG